MRTKSKPEASGPGKAARTDDIGIDLPANTKYLSGNFFNRFLIRNFMDALIELTRYDPHTDIFEIGTGEGLILRQLKLVLPNDVSISGADLDHQLLRVGQKIIDAVPLTCASVYDLPFENNRFDLVISTEVLEHLENPQQALNEICRVSRSSILLSVPNEPVWRMANFLRGKYWHDLGNTPGHIQHWSSQKFLSFVASKTKLIAVRRPFPWTMVLARVD
jgi:2-polyprenyl-3-methyl-5-hydroxy-6-metoxy-1,4-benzoquinol methylase